jgi:phospholipase/carboxylesterase
MKFDTDGWFLEQQQWGLLRGILIAPRKGPPSALVTLCHGFGASGTDLVSLAEEIVPLLPETLGAPAFLFPEALIDLESEFGSPGPRAWWLINMARLAQLAAVDDFTELRNEVPAGIDEARSALEGCVEACVEAHAWNSTQMILGGFSQGAMLAVDTALRSDRIKPIGVIAWSGALVCESTWVAAHAHHRRSFPVFQSHGRQDMVLPIGTGRALHGCLQDLDIPVDYVEFDGPHTISPKGIAGAAKLIELAVHSAK